MGMDNGWIDGSCQSIEMIVWLSYQTEADPRVRASVECQSTMLVQKHVSADSSNEELLQWENQFY